MTVRSAVAITRPGPSRSAGRPPTSSRDPSRRTRTRTCRARDPPGPRGGAGAPRPEPAGEAVGAGAARAPRAPGRAGGPVPGCRSGAWLLATSNEPGARFLRAGVRYCAAMDPSRKRRVRFVSALTAAVLLATALAYTSFAGASSSVEPSELAAVAKPGETYQLTGKVAAGSWTHEGVVHRFRVEDRAGGPSVAVTYTGAVPDPFREGREIILDVQKDGAGFVGQKDTLVTKCPSKFEAAEPGT